MLAEHGRLWRKAAGSSLTSAATAAETNAVVVAEPKLVPFPEGLWVTEVRHAFHSFLPYACSLMTIAAGCRWPVVLDIPLQW